ncbi:hypothetical protein HDU98_008061 [Podochytrium sp. JEL0797]|nr:hypothetical protein HDU98_008061 [Podochytrium sp. JEL0797]
MGGPLPRVFNGPLSLRADGKEVLNFPTILTSDGASGNKSLRPNKIENMFAMFAALPSKFRSSFISFLATSSAEWSLVAEAVLQDFAPDSELSLGCEMLDSSTGATILVISGVYAILVDNARGDQICSHAGAAANLYCRFCFARKGDLTAQLSRTLSSTLLVHQSMAAADSNAAKERLREATGVSIPINGIQNPYLHLLDPHKKTPFDLLHSVSLGAVRYAAEESKMIYNKKKPNAASRQLQSSVGALFKLQSLYQGPHSVTPVMFMCNVGSMIGKDFKAISQIAPYLYPWFDWRKRWLWIAFAALNKVCYDTHYVSRVDQRHLIERAAFAVQTLFARHLPHKANIQKLHLLAHAGEEFDYRGPLSNFAVEIPEHMNGDVRHALVNSNRHNSSRDTAEYFSTVEGIAQMLCGGQTPGVGVSRLAEDPRIRKALKLDPPSPPNKRRKIGQWVFFDDFRKIGLIRGLENARVTLNRAVPIGGFNVFGAPRFSISGAVEEVPLEKVNGQADMFHDCKIATALGVQGNSLKSLYYKFMHPVPSPVIFLLVSAKAPNEDLLLARLFSNSSGFLRVARIGEERRLSLLSNRSGFLRVVKVAACSPQACLESDADSFALNVSAFEAE